MSIWREGFRSALRNLVAGRTSHRLRSRSARRSRLRAESRYPISAEVQLLESRTLLNGVTPAAPGTWTAVTTAPLSANGIGTMMMLSDGRILAIGGGDTASKTWFTLTPDATGDYINGTWTAVAPMSLQRLFFTSNVLPSGKVFVLGGEYSGPNTQETLVNSGQIYDPAANTWSSIPNFPQANFGDDPTVVLPNGKILAGYIFDASTYLYNPATNSWSQTGSKLRGDRSDEETWVALPDGSVLSYDVFASPETGAGSAQRYIPATGTWIDAGSVPVPLTGSAYGFELGPATLLPDGRVFQVGANGNTAIYTPSTNSWVQGPNVPGGFLADDAPGAMLPNGHFIFAADSPPGIFTAPTKIFDFDPVANTITDVTPAGALGTTLNSQPAFLERMLVLPSGGIMMSASNNQLYEYTPTGSANTAWAPTVSNVTLNGTTFTLTGTQLTGLSQGASYGDDAESDSNYPIIRITTSGGTVKYAKSFNWTPGVATGSAVVTTQFTMPPGFGPGTYTLNVITNGIASADYTLNILAPPQNVSASAASTTTANVSWSAVQGADLGYQIFRVQGASNILVGSAAAGATSGTAINLISGANNTLFVRALSSTYLGAQETTPVFGFFADSATVNVAIPAGLLAPQGVTAVALSATTARVSWSAVAGANLGYQVYQQQGNILVGTAAAGVTSIIASGLTPAATDTLFVRALSSTLTPFQRDSSTINVVMPTAVGSLTLSVAVNTTLNTATLSWTAATGAAGYRIYEKIGTQIFLLGSVGTTGPLSLKVTGLKHGQTLQFMIEAFNGFVFTDSAWEDAAD
ncbi:MAG TPA: kelch repeat-containing protein [Planctomycetaceae bacterium]